MELKCLNCGCTHSLDSLVMANKGGEAFIQAFDVPPELKTPIIQYLGLFRSHSRSLSFDRLAKILAEINPIIRAKKVTFDKNTFDAPLTAWIWGIEQVIKQRDEGKLSLPLRNHNYLFSVMSRFDAKKDVNPSQNQAVKGEFVAFNGVKKPLLKGKTWQETWDIVNQAREPQENLDETYERIKNQY